VSPEPPTRLRLPLLLLAAGAFSASAAAISADGAGGTVLRIPIEGTIDLGLAPFVSRVVEEAAESGAVVLLDINTFGGRVDAAVLIRDALIDAPVKTVAFVNPRAISAGALISLACETIAMRPGGTIGAATPVTGGGTEEMTAADEKVVSYMRTEMRSTAERRGRNPDIAAAMVDRDVEVEGLIEKGKVLTLTTEEAVRTGIADREVASLEALLEELGLGNAEVVDRQLNWAEQLARAISNPVVSSLLLSLGFLGIILELYQPGWGLPGSLGLIALVTFFFGHHVVQLAGLEEILLFVLGLGLIALELLVIPGFGVVGLLGMAIVLGAVVMSLIGLDLRVSWELGFLQHALTVTASAVVLTVVGGGLMLWLLPASGVTRRLVLRRVLRGDQGFRSHGDESERELPAGTRGKALSDLRPAGRARFGSRRLDVVSEGGYITATTEVRIVAWRAGTAVVRRAQDDEPGSAEQPVAPLHGEPPE
jgi:membrane-bound serine protease (ClpP class)